jgi:hypothetical protein
MQYSQSPPLAEASDLEAISDQRIGKRPGKPSIHSPRSASFRDDRFVSERPSVGRRMLRALTRFFIAVLIGVGATLGWQSYGDEARNMAIAQAPTLAWLMSISATKPAAMAAAPSPDPAQQLAPLASNLDAVRRSVEQLAVKQDQMAQNIAALQAVEEDIRQKMSSAPPSVSQQPAAIPPPKPPQPRAQSPSVQSSSGSRPPPPAGPLLLTR